MGHIDLPSGHVAFFDDEDLEKIQRFAWHARPKRETWYAVGERWEGGKRVERTTMHRLVTGAAKGQIFDHENWDGLDNRKANLRPATHRQNSHNRGKWRRSEKSPFIGVFKLPNGRYRVLVNNGEKNIYLGQYDDPVLAARYYDREVLLRRGEFAVTNFEYPGGVPPDLPLYDKRGYRAKEMA